VAHDANCMRVPPFAVRRSELLLFRYGLHRADAVITQTRRQERMLLATFGVPSLVIPSCVPAWPEPDEDSFQASGAEDMGDEVLWVGRLSEEKRPEWLIRLATDLPECHFNVVGQCNVGSNYGLGLATQIEALANIRWRGYAPHVSLKRLYRRCRVL